MWPGLRVHARRHGHAPTRVPLHERGRRGPEHQLLHHCVCRGALCQGSCPPSPGDQQPALGSRGRRQRDGFAHLLGEGVLSRSASCFESKDWKASPGLFLHTSAPAQGWTHIRTRVGARVGPERAPCLGSSPDGRGPASGRSREATFAPGPAQAGAPRSEVVGALQQGGDGVLQGHGHLLGGLAQQRAVGVVLLQVQDVALLALGRAATLLAHVQLGPPLLVRVLLLHAVDLLEMRLQRAALREGLVTQAALVGPHACGRTGPGVRDPIVEARPSAAPGGPGRGAREDVCPEPPGLCRAGPLTCVGAYVSLQVEGVIETLPAVGAEVPLDVVVTLHVAIQHALVGEGLLADVAGEEVSTGTVPQGHLWARLVLVTDTQGLALQVADWKDTHTSPPAP